MIWQYQVCGIVNNNCNCPSIHAENQIIGRSMSYPGTIVGAIPILTSGKRVFSGWPLYITSNNKLCLGIRKKMAYEEQDEATSLYISYIITQTRCTMVLLLAVISEESCSCQCCASTSGSQPREKNLEPAQKAKSESNLTEHINLSINQII